MAWTLMLIQFWLYIIYDLYMVGSLAAFPTHYYGTRESTVSLYIPVLSMSSMVGKAWLHSQLMTRRP
jgi:hypothetical protein